MIETAVPALFDIPLRADNKESIIIAALADGWNQAGSGKFSTVLYRGDRALKIFDDLAYLHYLEHLVEPHNRAYPIVIEGPIIGHALSAVYLERLHTMDDDHHTSTIARTIRDAINDELDARATRTHSTILNSLIEAIGTHAVDALGSILTMATHFGMSTDIEPKNIMRRPSTGEIVFTDPVYYA